MVTLLARTDKDILDVYKIALGKKDSLSEIQPNNDHFLVSEMMDFVSELGKAEFLFSQDIAEYSAMLSSELLLIISNCLVLKQDYIKAGKESLNEILTTFETNKIGGKMAAELRLVSKPSWLGRRILRGKKR